MTDPIRMIRLREELLERLRCHLPGPGIHPTAIEGLNLVLREESGKAEKCFERPLVGLVVQGTKHSFMGGRDYTYGDGQSVVVAVDMPIISCDGPLAGQTFPVYLPLSEQGHDSIAGGGDAV